METASSFPTAATGFGSLARLLARASCPSLKPGSDAYVEAAGGRAEGAQEVYVVEAGTGRLAPEAGQALELGDAVFVSREAVADTPQSAQLALQQQQADRDEIRQQREERRDERQVRFQLAQTAISAVAATASIIFAVIALK